MTLIFSNENRILFDAKITDQLLSLYYGNRFTSVLDLKNFYSKQKSCVSYKPSRFPRGVAFSPKKLLAPADPFKTRHVAFLEKKLRKETKLPFNKKLFDKENNYKINLSTPFLPKLFAFSTKKLSQKGVQKKRPRRAIPGTGNFFVEKASKGVKNFYNTSIRNFFHQAPICKLKSSKKRSSKYCFSELVSVTQRDQHIDKSLNFTQVPITNNKFQFKGGRAHVVGTNQRFASPFTHLLCKSDLFYIAKERNTLSRSVSEVFLEKKLPAPLSPSLRAVPCPKGGKRCPNSLKGVRACKERQLVPPPGHGRTQQKEGNIRFSIKQQIKKNVPEAFFSRCREGSLEVEIPVRKAENQKIYTKIFINNYIDFLKEKVVLALLPLGSTLCVVKVFFLKSVPFKLRRALSQRDKAQHAQSNTIKIKIWTFAFGSSFLLISITSILKKQEKNSWLFPFFKTQMPGLYQISQESSLESFENITSKYINRTDFASKVVPQLALQTKQGYAARALLCSPLEQSSVQQRTEGERRAQAVLFRKQSETKDGVKKAVNKAPNLIKNINFYRDKLDIDFSESWNQQQIQNFKAIFSKSHFYVPVPKWFLNPFRSNFLTLSTKKLDFQETHSWLKKLHLRLCSHVPYGYVKRNLRGEVQRVKSSRFCFSKRYEYSSLEKRLNKKKAVLQKIGNDLSYEIAGFAAVPERPFGVAFFQKVSERSSKALFFRKQKNVFVRIAPNACCAFEVPDGDMCAPRGKTQRGFASTNNGIKSNCLLRQPWYELNARIAPKTFITKKRFKKLDFSEKKLSVPKLFWKKSYVPLAPPLGHGNESAESSKKAIEKAKQKKSTLFKIEEYKTRVNVENDSIPSKMSCSIEKNKKINKNFINSSSKILKNFFYKYGNFSIPDRLLQESTEKEEVKRAEEEEIKSAEEEEIKSAEEEEFLYDFSTSLNNLVPVNDLQHLVFSTPFRPSCGPCLPLRALTGEEAFCKKATPKGHRGGTETARSFFRENASPNPPAERQGRKRRVFSKLFLKKSDIPTLSSLGNNKEKTKRENFRSFASTKEGQETKGFHKPKVCELSFAPPIFKSNLPTSLYRLSFSALNFNVLHGQKLRAALLTQEDRKTVRVKKRYTIRNRLPIDKISSFALDQENSINNRLMSGYRIPEIENLQLASKNTKKVPFRRALYNGSPATFFETFSQKKLPLEDVEKAKTKKSTETQFDLAHMNNVHIKIPPALPFYESKINNFFVARTTNCPAVLCPFTCKHRLIPCRGARARARAKIAFRSFFSFSTKKLRDPTCVPVPEAFCKKATPTPKVFGLLKGSKNSGARKPKAVEKKATCSSLPEPSKGGKGTAKNGKKGGSKKSFAFTKEGEREESIAHKTNYHVPVVNRQKYIEESNRIKHIGKEAPILNEAFTRFLSNNKNKKGNTLPPIKALKKMPYKKLSLKCFQEVKPLFEQVNQEFRISPYRFSFKNSLFSDYNDYLSWQKDTPAAISISPSFEEDKAIEDSWNAHIEKENLVKEIERENLTKEQANNSSKSSSLKLQTDKEDLNGNPYTEGVEVDDTDSQPSTSFLPQKGMGNFFEEKAKSRPDKVLEEASQIVDEEADEEEEEEDKKEEDKRKDITTFEWLLFIRDTDALVEKRKDFQKLAYSNKEALFTKRLPIQKGKIQKQLVKDRKDSFFGITNLFPKRLIARDQKQINDQILQEEHYKRSIALFEQLQSKKDDADTPFSYLAQDDKEPILVEQLLENGVLTKLQNYQLGKQAFLPSKDLKENVQEGGYLHKKALYANKIFISKEIAPRNRESSKVLLPYLEGTTKFSEIIKAKSFSCLSSRQHPIYTPNRRLRLRLPESSLSSQNNDPESFIDDLDLTRSHKWWQKRRIASNLLGAPSKRYLAMPELTAQDWRKIVEWQLKTYFLEEEKRIGSLVLEKGVHNSAKNFFKLKKIAIYLPWTTLKKSLKKPFEWPLTGLSYQSNYTFRQHFEGKRLNLQKNSFAVPLPDTFAHRFDLPSKDRVRARSIVKKERNFLQNRKNDSCFVSSISPQFKRSALSCLKGSRPSYSVKQKVVFDNNSRLFGGHATCKNMQISITNKQLQKNSIYKPFLFEQVTEHSHLFLHQLLLAVTIKQFLYSIYKVFGKIIVDRIKNSSLAIAFLPLFFNNDSRSNQVATFYALKKRFKDLAGSEHTISSLSEIVWYLRNSCRGRMVPRGVVLVESVSAESTDFLKAIGGEAQVPVIVQSLRALPFTQNHPQRRLEKILTFAQKKAPCILFLDDLDAIGQSRTLLLKNNLNYRNGLRTRARTAREAHNSKGRNSLPHFLSRSNLSLKSTAAQLCVAKPTRAHLRCAKVKGQPSVLHNALLLPSSSLKEAPNSPFYFASQKVAPKGSKERQGKTSSPLFGQSSTLEKKKWKRFKKDLTDTFYIEGNSSLSKSVVQSKRTSFNLNLKASFAFSTLFLRFLYEKVSPRSPNTFGEGVAFLQKASGKKSCAFLSFLLFRRKSYMTSPEGASRENKMTFRVSFFTKSFGYKKSDPFTEGAGFFGKRRESVEKVKSFGTEARGISKAFKLSSAQPQTKLKKVLRKQPLFSSAINRKSANPILHTVLLNNLFSKNLLYQFKSPQNNCKSVISSCKRKSFATTTSLCNIGDIFLNREESNSANRRGLGEQPRKTSIKNTNLSKTEEIIEQRRVDLMLRLLTVMDGITHLNGVLIVTTSKNPSLLDPALLRPGRFERLINLKLPNKKRRIELLKVQTSKIGYTHPMPWEYFGTRTKDMTATEIASAINHSAFRAIIQSTAHTVRTLEYGISCVNDEGFTSYPFGFSTALSTPHQSNVGNKITRSSLKIVRDARHTKSKSFALAYRQHLEKPKLYSIQKEIELKELLGFSYVQQKFVTKKDFKSICVHNPYKPFLRNETFACSECLDVPCRALIHFRGFGKRGEKRGKRGHKLEASLFNKSTKNKKKRIKNNFKYRAKKEKRWNGVGKTHYQDFRKYLPFGQNNNPNYFFSLFNKSNRDFLWSRKIVETLRVSKLDLGNWYRLYLPRTEQNKNNREWLYPDKFFNQHISRLNINTFSPSLRAVPYKTRRGSFFVRSTALKLRDGLFRGKKVARSFFCIRSFFTKSYSGERMLKCGFYYAKPRMGDKEEEEVRRGKKGPNFKALFLRKAKKTLCATFAQRRCTRVRNPKGIQKNSELSYHKLLLSCFYMSFQKCTENRELLDLLADHLVRFKLLRSHEIIRISSFYVDLKAL